MPRCRPREQMYGSVLNRGVLAKDSRENYAIEQIVTEVLQSAPPANR